MRGSRPDNRLPERLRGGVSCSTRSPKIFPIGQPPQSNRQKRRNGLDKLVTEGRGAGTVRKTWLGATKTVYRWGVRRKLVPHNPFAEAVVDVPRRKHHRPKWFYPHEWRTILKAANAISGTTTPDSAARRWVPWLLAYTGARPAEITQLRGVDLERMEDIWTLNLTPAAGTI